jgi:16S rRNA (adenine1518-N6/adenine1519-N6)-dimethyltransferase
MYSKLSELKEIFKSSNFRPTKKLGQNFCIDPNLLSNIPGRAGVTTGDLVVEIGTGTGLLTRALAERAGFVFSIELDASLLEIARQHNKEAENVEFMHGDVLERKSALSTAFVKRIGELSDEKGLPGLKMVSNLPYCIAVPVIMNILNLGRRPDSMTFLIQKELAEKLVVEPGSKTFGSMSVLTRVFYTTEILRVYPPKIFWPRPKVESALVHMTLRPAPLAVKDYPFFSAFIRKLFLMRRKNLKNVLSTIIPREQREIIPQALEKLNIEQRIRLEAVPLEKIIMLGNEFYDMLSP